MKANDVRLVWRDELALCGVWGKASDRTIAKDIPELSAKYHRLTGTGDGAVLPFVVLSRNYDVSTGCSELFIGSTAEYEGLSRLVLPGGEYAVVAVKPKLGLFWGAAVGEAKRLFYTRWLPQSRYEAKNLEYELHTDKAKGKAPEIELIFAISLRS